MTDSACGTSGASTATAAMPALFSVTDHADYHTDYYRRKNDTNYHRCEIICKPLHLSFSFQREVFLGLKSIYPAKAITAMAAARPTGSIFPENTEPNWYMQSEVQYANAH